MNVILRELYNIAHGMSEPPFLPSSCELCAYAQTTHPVMEEILAFVTESAEHMPLDAVCVQVQKALSSRLDINMSEEHIREHFLAHRCEQAVVLSHVLRDLVDILCVAKNTCIVENVETGQQGMDSKNTAVYLDTIKQIISVYRQVETCGKRKRTL